ncbi:unnamed protein product [Ambrosiozyma monospora]|uniref:Unnamed protein product n=1 Tax=Ambrosiozyma monospora TaxID=43982 RepID=A0ACB5U0N9_AMBMO|nr:unnamed protein product [Ambrosiozyma monospora]
MTIPKRLKNHISLLITGLQIIDEETLEPVKLQLKYYTLNYNKKNRYRFSKDDYLYGSELFFNIDFAELAGLDVLVARYCGLIFERRKYYYEDLMDVNNKFFFRTGYQGYYPYQRPWPTYVES